MSKPQAAKFLGVAIRTLEQFMHDGRIAFVYVPGKTNRRAAFKLEDLEALKTEIAAPIYPNRHRNIPKRRTRAELFDTLSRDVRRVERSLDTLRNDLCFVAEVLLIQGGRSEQEARKWVRDNLDLTDDG